LTKSASHRTKIRYDWDPWLGNQRKNSGFWAKMTADSPRADLGPRAVGTPGAGASFGCNIDLVCGTGVPRHQGNTLTDITGEGWEVRQLQPSSHPPLSLKNEKILTLAGGAAAAGGEGGGAPPRLHGGVHRDH